jgi:hypothetical protein
MHSVIEKKKKAFRRLPVRQYSMIIAEKLFEVWISMGVCAFFLLNAWVSPEPYLATKFVSLSCRQIYTNGKDHAPLNTRMLTILLPGL